MRVILVDVPPVRGRLRPSQHVLLVRQHEASEIENVLDQTGLHVDVHSGV